MSEEPALDEQVIQTHLSMIQTAVNLLLKRQALTPTQLQAEINDMIHPYYTEDPS